MHLLFALIVLAAPISNDRRVVVYSGDPLIAARAFVTLEAAGHQRVHVLNGGAAGWKAVGGPVNTKPTTPAGRRPSPFAHYDQNFLDKRLALHPAKSEPS